MLIYSVKKLEFDEIKKQLSGFGSTEYGRYEAELIKFSRIRNEIEKKLEEQIKTELTSFKIEIEKLYISSVKLPDDLKDKNKKEYINGFNSINDCSNEIKGVITEIEYGTQPDEYIVNYKFIIDNKSYEGSLFSEDLREKVSIGDSLIFEYSCENAIFHRIKNR